MSEPEDDREPLDLDRGLPTTPEDVEVLRRLREGGPMPFEEYLRALSLLKPPSWEELRARRGPRGEPFRLD
jgi:hypothetical protein